MSELTLEERMQPALLDRLTDRDPDSKAEPAERRFLNTRELRQAVIRDLQWLLNTPNYVCTSSLEGTPEIESSVINYGIPDLSGSLASSVTLLQVEQSFKNAILNFEPRILRNSLVVKGTVEEDEMNHNTLTFEIEAEVWGNPAPFHLMLKTEMDLDTGTVTVSDFNG